MLSAGSEVNFFSGPLFCTVRSTKLSSVFHGLWLYLLDGSSFLIFLVALHENKIGDYVLG